MTQNVDCFAIADARVPHLFQFVFATTSPGVKKCDAASNQPLVQVATRTIVGEAPARLLPRVAQLP